MGIPFVEKRAVRNGSIICDNGFTSLRVIRSDFSLELAIDSVESDAGKFSLHYTSSGASCRAVAPSGEKQLLQYYAFDPILVDGTTRGVKLLGSLDSNPVTLTAMLDPSSPWCHIHFEVQPSTPVTIMRLAHCWRLQPEWAEPDISWPEATAYHQRLLETPAAFFQLGPLFAALMPDLEEGDYLQLGCRTRGAEELQLEYGIMSEDARAFDLKEPLRFAYTLCLDTSAMPEYGYQEIVRMLGATDMLKLASISPTPASPGSLPELPPAPDAEGWLPFASEGSPAEIGALVQRYFQQSGEQDWQSLDLGLRWLDRLCLHQHLVEVPGGPGYGSVGSGQEWALVAQWMPQLLLTAFQLTGIQEYAYRGMAALNALQPAERAIALNHLREQFGDIYINTDYSEAVLLTAINNFHSKISSDTVELNVACTEDRTGPLRLVLESTQDAYTLVINGERLGHLPICMLRAGIELPA